MIRPVVSKIQIALPQTTLPDKKQQTRTHLIWGEMGVVCPVLVADCDDERRKFESSSISETIGHSSSASFQSQLLTGESEAEEEPIQTDFAG